MNKLFAALTCAALATNLCEAQYASQTFVPVKNTDRSVYFATEAQGEYLPIVWGLDTAWPDEGNIIRGVRFIGAENIGVARVSFQPWEFMPTTVLTPRLEQNLQERLRLVSHIGGPGTVQLVLNNDGPLEECNTLYFHSADDPEACRGYCNLIYGTMLSCQDKGWEVITASPLNEPDYVWNGQGSMDDFLAIARMLKTEYPQFMDGKVRISGGNTLNCDQAEPWYTYLYDYIDEGNTHQLAGDFDHYADFFTKVRADGKYATADELHNVMEAMVGVEYGMQTGIWWGTAELARGEFCKASFGQRLAYAENRRAWSSASVYRAPDGRIQGFVGQSERQADVCTYRFVSQDRDVFFNGHGPQREYVVDLPGGVGYQLPTQTSAECVIDITWGEDVSPVISGNYKVMNKSDLQVMGITGEAANLKPLELDKPDALQSTDWEILPVPVTIGGDFSYYSIKLADNTAYKLDVINWSLDDGGGIILYDGGMGNNEQWYLKYAGDGWFRIFSRHSNLCLQYTSKGDTERRQVVQGPVSDSDSQLWRLIPVDATCELDAPEAPSALTAQANTASIALEWTGSISADVEQYCIVRAEAGSDDFTTIARGLKETSFTDNTVEPGHEYKYKVKAVDRACNSSDFSEVATCAVAAGTNLVAHWSFDKSLADDTPNHFDAAAYDGMRVLYVKRDEGNYALNLALNRFVQLPYQTFNHDEMTVGTWLSLNTKGSQQTIFNYGTDNEHYVSLDVTPAATLQLTRCEGGAFTSISGGELTVDEWHHIAATISTDRTALYVDGVEVASGDGFEATPATLNYLGSNQDRKDGFLSGLLDDFCIYQGVLPADDIARMMDGVVGISDTMADGVLVATEYYNMMGVRVASPLGGVYIVKRLYDNGKVSTSKEIIR